MKIIYFNLNYGRIDIEGILDFLAKNGDVDVFCFQEVKGDFETKIDETLKNYNKSSFYRELDDWVMYNIVIYVSKRYENINFEIMNKEDSLTPPALLLKINDGNLKWNILNFHGTPFPGDKLDSNERIENSKKIISFMENIEGKKIIGGDFNLMPNTKSIEMFEKTGYRNLIKDYKIKTTRNENSWKQYPDTPQLFADYVFVSKEIEVKNFQVIENLISDHLPLILEI